LELLKELGRSDRASRRALEFQSGQSAAMWPEFALRAGKSSSRLDADMQNPPGAKFEIPRSDEGRRLRMRFAR